MLALEPPDGIDARSFAVAMEPVPTTTTRLAGAVPHRALTDAGQDLLFAPGQIERYASRVTDAPGRAPSQAARQPRA